MSIVRRRYVVEAIRIAMPNDINTELGAKSPDVPSNKGVS